ncbi:MAG: hypothetical protein IIA05_11075 [Proteobacteria bacterium]|nr:hypothetical protein [Pseudomonadota bacterium]
MKKSFMAILATATLLGSGVARAAECRYEQNTTDKLSNEIVVITRWDELTHWLRQIAREITGHVSAASYGDQKYLRIQIEHARPSILAPSQGVLENSIAVPDGGELLVAMEDGTVITLYADRAVTGHTTFVPPHTGEYDNDFYWLTTFATIQYDLDASALEALMAQGAKAVRIFTSTGYHDIRIHKRNLGDIQKAIGCIL